MLDTNVASFNNVLNNASDNANIALFSGIICSSFAMRILTSFLIFLIKGIEEFSTNSEYM